MKFAALLFLAGLAWGQTLSMTTSGVAFPGGTIGVTVSCTGCTGQLIGAISGSLGAGVSNMAAGAASSAATKTLVSVMTPGGPTNFLLVGFAPPSTITNNPYSDGVIATFSYVVPSTLAQGASFTIAISNPLGATVNGDPVTITATPVTLQAGITAACLTSVQSAINAYNSNQTQLGIGGIETKFKTALATGTCQ